MNQGDMNYCKMEIRSYTNIHHRFYTAQTLDVQNVQTCSWHPCFWGNHDKDGISSENLAKIIFAKLCSKGPTI
jgi:hypothetical protein